jgi:hypothetical protein
VQQKDQNTMNKNLATFAVNDAYLFDGYQSNNVRNAGMNPPNGVVINYYLKEVKENTNVSIELLDRNKKLIKTFSNKAKEKDKQLDIAAGMNQLIWNLRYDSATKVRGLIIWHGNVPGPRAAPGTYFYKIKADKDSTEGSFVIKGNPVYGLSQQDYDAQFDFLLSVRDKYSAIQNALMNIGNLRKQMTDFAALQGKAMPTAIKQQADTIQKQMTAVEEALHQTKAKSGQDVLNFPIRLDDKISGLYDFASSGYAAPAKQVKEAYVILAGEADVQLNKLKKIMDTDVPLLNKMIRDNTLPVIGIKPEVE